MPGTETEPDEFFLAEFGSGDLASRLWRGGLRADEKGYKCASTTRVLANALKDGLDAGVTDGSVSDIINEIETCWNDPARMRRACQIMGGSESQHASALSVSLAKMVLSIDLFQPAMVTCIVNKISEFGEESSSDSDIAKVLLNQLRWLDFVVDGPALCESLLSIVPVVSSSVQRVLIEALPEILDDSSREVAVTELVRILQESPSMMGSVVDALAALGVDDARLPDVNSSILSTLNAAHRDMLPVSLRYLLRTCPPTMLTSTVTALRHALAMPSLGPGPGRLCLDAVKSGLRMKKSVADHVVKVLRGIDKPSDHRPADFWMLIALLDSPMHRKAAEVVFRKKAAKNAFSKALIDAALAPFAAAFGGLTNRLLEMSSIAVRSSELGARGTGVTLYALLFRLFPEGNTRRNIVTALLDHTGTRRAQEMDAALEALALIAKESESDRTLLPHSASIQGLLDFLEFFSDSQLRQIWTILGFLCRACCSNGGDRREAIEESRQREKNSKKQAAVDLQDEEDGGESELAMLEILLRKELTHPDTFYRRIGVLGACTMIKVLGSSVKNSILSMMLDVGRSHPLSQALAFDELAQVFGTGTPTSRDTAESIRKTIANVFEKKYITDREGLGSLTKEEELLPAQLFGNLEGEDVEFCFSISSLVRDEKTLVESQDAVRAMVPNLRLLCVMTANRYEGSLSEVDAIIGAPLHLPLVPTEQDVMTLPTRAKGDVLLSLFIAHGWIVELLNGFSGQESTEIRAKCVKRVDDLLALTSQISLCVSQIPLWKEVIFDAYSGTRGDHEHRGSAAPCRKARKGLKGTCVVRESREGASGFSRGHEWLAFARQLNPTALSLIRITTPITWRFTEVESDYVREGNPETETVTLSAKGLLYLLSELAMHVEYLVDGELHNSTAFGVTLFRSTGGTATRTERGTTMSEASTGSRLKKFTELRTPLTAVGAQLCRCMKRVFPGNGDNNREDDATIEMLRQCTDLSLKSLAIALNSRLLSDAMAEELLFTILASIRLDGSRALEASDPFTSEDAHLAAKQAFGQLRVMLKEVLSADASDVDSDQRIGCANEVGLLGCCAFLAAMDSVFGYCSEKDQKTLRLQFSKSAHSVLMHQWDVSTLRSRKTQKLIPGLVKIYVQTSADPFETAEELRVKIVKLNEKQAELQKKPIGTQDVNRSADPDQPGTLTEQTCNSFSVAILEQYLWLFKSFHPRSFDDPEKAFERMAAFMKAELPLYTLARQNQRMLGPVMRAGRTFVDIFSKSCLSFLKENFKEYRNSVVQICKMHQKPTRILQTFCAHSKFTRDSSLTGLVPPLRKSLELLLYRVKDLLQSHNATDAFQLGNLKHRDINGDVLSSQHLQYKSESEGASEYSSEEGTDEDGDEQESRITGRSGASKGNRNRKTRSIVSRAEGKKKSKAGKRKNAPKKLKKSKAQKENMADLDLGSDVDSAASRAGRGFVNDDMDAREEDVGEDQASMTQPRKAKRRRVNEGSHDARRRHPLIDDEAVEGSDAEDDDDPGDLSQFLVFGDEEEEE